MTSFYFLLDGDIIIDAIDYASAGYVEAVLDQITLPPGINGGYYRWNGTVYTLDEALRDAQIVTGLSKASVGLENVDNTSDTAKPVSTAQQAALNLKASNTAVNLKADIAAVNLKADITTTNLKANINSPTFTGTVSGVMALYTATISTASWMGTSSPYTSSVAVTGILETDTPIIDVVMTGTFVDDEAIIESWGSVYRAVTTANVVTFSATDLPVVNLPIQLKVVR